MTPGAATTAAADGASVALTETERLWLATSGPVTMCVDPDWEPFERIDEAGRHVGIAADLLRLVATRLGIDIVLHPTGSWDESLAASKAGHCRILSFLNRTPERERWLVFTEPIFRDQNIVITREEHPYIGDLHGVSDETVALPRGTMVEERLRRLYPNLQITTTGSEPEAVEMVSERRADMTIRSLIVAAYAIRKEGLFNLKIAGQVPELTNELRVGVLAGEPMLRDILDKGIATVTAQEREAISNRHVAVQIQRGIDYRLVWQVGAAAAVLLLLALYWNRKLARMNRELVRLSTTDPLTGLFNRMKVDGFLDEELARARRTSQSFGVIMLDLDHFKAVNDQHGHQLGDAVLVDVAALLRAGQGPGGMAGRWGGEEFILVCPGADLPETARRAEALRAAIAAHGFAVGPCTGSFGVAAWRPEDRVEDIVRRADAALYDAKRAGRNRVCRATDETHGTPHRAAG
ncbi:diguanylate cyclase [Tistrella mobilis]|uniref:diguanylate cyclase n=1 Tax=Tistrella mobilis TaxID=171437 RepID=UPI0035586602